MSEILRGRSAYIPNASTGQSLGACSHPNFRGVVMRVEEEGHSSYFRVWTILQEVVTSSPRLMFG